MTSKVRGLRRNASKKGNQVVTQNTPDATTTAVTQTLQGYMQNLNTQRADLINKKREAEAMIVQYETGINQCDGAMAAYQETLRLLNPAASGPTLVPQTTVPVQEAQPIPPSPLVNPNPVKVTDGENKTQDNSEAIQTEA